nr:hypothetical protein [Tanacetum cinerariifolium]
MGVAGCGGEAARKEGSGVVESGGKRGCEQWQFKTWEGEGYCLEYLHYWPLWFIKDLQELLMSKVTPISRRKLIIRKIKDKRIIFKKRNIILSSGTATTNLFQIKAEVFKFRQRIIKVGCGGEAAAKGGSRVVESGEKRGCEQWQFKMWEGEGYCLEYLHYWPLWFIKDLQEKALVLDTSDNYKNSPCLYTLRNTLLCMWLCIRLILDQLLPPSGIPAGLGFRSFTSRSRNQSVLKHTIRISQVTYRSACLMLALEGFPSSL